MQPSSSDSSIPAADNRKPYEDRCYYAFAVQDAGSSDIRHRVCGFKIVSFLAAGGDFFGVDTDFATSQNPTNENERKSLK